MCKPLINLEYGRIDYSSPEVDGKHPPGTVANFTCDPGLPLHGPTSITCTGHNYFYWTGDVPTCGTGNKMINLIQVYSLKSEY